MHSSAASTPLTAPGRKALTGKAPVHSQGFSHPPGRAWRSQGWGVFRCVRANPLMLEVLSCP